jgi:hypothetical protein
MLPSAAGAKLPSYSWPEITARDEQRRSQVREILAKGGATTGEDFYDAAFIFQHGQQADDYLFAHIIATEAVVLGYSRAKWICVATLDRYLEQIGQKQVFGTQYLDERYAYYLQHKNDTDLKEEIKSIGTQQTLEPYDETLVPDKIRADFCVPSLAVQQKHIQDVRAGTQKASDLPRVADCLR